MKTKLFFGAFALVCAAAFATNLVADGYDEDALAHYMRLFARSTPAKAQLGVEVYPRSIFRKESSAENMSSFLPGNQAGRPPAVYHVEYYVPRGDYSAIVAHYSKFADPAASPIESVVSGMKRTNIELARDGAPKQRIVIYDRTNGHGCTQSSIDEEGQGTGPCVLVHIVSRGEASWAAAGRGQPRPVTQTAATTNNNNRNTNTAANSNTSNNNNGTANNNNNSNRQQNCESAAQTGQNVGSSTGNNAAYAVGGDWRAAAAGRAIGGLLGRATAKKSNNNCQ